MKLCACATYYCGKEGLIIIRKSGQIASPFSGLTSLNGTSVKSFDELFPHDTAPSGTDSAPAPSMDTAPSGSDSAPAPSMYTAPSGSDSAPAPSMKEPLVTHHQFSDDEIKMIVRIKYWWRRQYPAVKARRAWEQLPETKAIKRFQNLVKEHSLEHDSQLRFSFAKLLIWNGVPTSLELASLDEQLRGAEERVAKLLDKINIHLEMFQQLDMILSELERAKLLAAKASTDMTDGSIAGSIAKGSVNQLEEVLKIIDAQVHEAGEIVLDVDKGLESLLAVK